MFMAASFEISKTWKQPRFPSVGEWINKLWCMADSGIGFSAKKKGVIKP